MTKIHLVPCLKQFRGWRTEIIIEQGLKNHPNVELVRADQDYDFVFMNALCLSGYSAANNYDFDPNKVVFIDFWDAPTGIFHHIKHLCYFKRSCAIPQNNKGFSVKKLIDRPGIHQTSMAILDQFIFEGDPDRDIDVGCYFNGKTNNTNRDSIFKIAQSINCKNSKIGLASPCGVAGRSNYHQDYFNHLKRTKITITCQPDRWDGDWRTWEALASGTLMFVDPIHAKIDHPLEDGKHCIFYELSPQGMKDMIDKVYYYLSHDAEREKIAKNGKEFAMKHHRSVNRVDSMIKTAERVKSERLQ